MNLGDLPPLPAIVDGTVAHLRREPIAASFTHRAHLWLVDVDDLPHYGPLARFDVRDHLGSPAQSLRANVEQFVRANGLATPLGRIVMLAAARVAGYVFDPLSVFWCFDDAGDLACVVAEVHNTYGERDAYLLQLDEDGRTRTDKKFYVSPFFDVSGRYLMTFDLTPDRVAVTIDLMHADDEPVFSASFRGTPALATCRHVVLTSARQPLMPQRVTALIRAHGIALWLRRLPIVDRPEHAPADGVAPGAAWDDIPAVPRSVVRSRIAGVLARSAARRAGVTLLQVPGGHVTADVAAASGAPDDAPALIVTDAVFARLAAHPKIGLAESYLAGEWDAAPGTDLADALRPFAEHLTTVLPGWAWRLRRLTDDALPDATRNTRGGSRRNIEAHYDLSNALFEHFLDETLSYSSALFDPATPDEPLAAAQRRKIDAVLDLAQVQPGTRLLEIGSGWGSLALRAAERGAQVVSVTLSQDQLATAQARSAASDHGGNVEFRLQDYRDVEGTYDAIVSVEMVEAVGEEYWREYLTVLHDRLRPGGRAVVQAITMSDERMQATRNSHGWIQEYIFPGGLIPSVAGLQRAAAGLPLSITSERRFGPDYARTLRLWRTRFEAEWPAIAQLGFSENFHRMWRLYLAYCEAGFSSGYLNVEHLLVERQLS